MTYILAISIVCMLNYSYIVEKQAKNYAFMHESRKKHLKTAIFAFSGVFYCRQSGSNRHSI